MYADSSRAAEYLAAGHKMVKIAEGDPAPKTPTEAARELEDVSAQLKKAVKTTKTTRKKG